MVGKGKLLIVNQFNASSWFIGVLFDENIIEFIQDQYLPGPALENAIVHIYIKESAITVKQ